MENSEIKSAQPELTEKDIWDVVQFARSLTGGVYGGLYGLSTPDLLNSKLKDINLNPMQATQTELESALENPKENESQLRMISQSFEIQSMVYKRLISYLANMLSFDITYTTTAKPKDYSSAKYRKDESAFEEFLDNFDYKQDFRIIVREMLRNDAYFGCIREGNGKTMMQELPPEYCKITGKWHAGFTFSFNMNWFLQPGVDISMYPDFFRQAYNELYDTNELFKQRAKIRDPYLILTSPDGWVEVPTDIGVCFKLSPELATRLPYFTPLFNDLILQGLMRTLQKNMNMAAASKIIMGEVPLLNKDTKATVRDSIAVSPELLGKFMALVKSALSDSIKVASAPLQEIEGISFDTDNEMYDSYLRTALASSGINTNLIFSSDVKPNAIETQLSLNVDEQMMTSLYSQFEAFMNVQIDKLTRTFKFICSFEGTDFYINRENRLETALKLFDKGIVLPQKISAAIGLKPHELRRHMEEAQATNFMDLLLVPAVHQADELNKIAPEEGVSSSSDKASGETVKQGRPKKSTSKISEEGVQTRTEGTNVGRGGK